MVPRIPSSLVVLALVTSLAACSSRGGSRSQSRVAGPTPPPASATVSASAASAVATAPVLTPAESKREEPEPAPEAPATVDSLDVRGDVRASIVRGPRGAAPRTVFVPGLCSNAYAYLLGFPEAARQQGGVVAIDGDVPCVPGFRSFSWDAGRLDARITAALAAAGTATFPEEGITLVGYSQGAALAEQLIQRWPARYTRLVLIGAPTDPSPAHFRTAKGVVTMSCALDVPWRMKEAARGLARVGVPSRYVEMPGCTHGNIGKGDETLGAAFEFLRGDT